MRLLTLALATLALTAGSAEAGTHRLTVDDTARWTTPEEFASDDLVQIRVRVNGDWARHAAYRGRQALVFRKNGVLVEARAPERIGRVRFRIANFRERNATVKIVYRRR